jgi:hypothetical protein
MIFESLRFLSRFLKTHSNLTIRPNNSQMAIKSAMGPLFALLLLFAQLSFAMESTDKGVSSTESIL